MPSFGEVPSNRNSRISNRDDRLAPVVKIDGVLGADVVVVGGGPAGSAAAIAVAASGMRPVVLDRQQFPRDKPCGDGVTPRGVAMLDVLGVGDEARRTFHYFDGYRLRMPPRSLERKLPHSRAGLPVRGLVAARRQLDQMLVQRACALGATFVPGAHVSNLLWDDGRVVGVRATIDGTPISVRARIVVGADGATSRIARAMGVDDRSTVFGYAARAEIESPMGDGHSIEVFPRLGVKRRFVPGYGWAFPMGCGRANVGVGFIPSSAIGPNAIRQLQEAFFEQVPSSWDMGDWSSSKWNGWKLVMGLGRRPLWRPGVMLAGDAAGTIRPSSGAGISKGLRSGFLAGVTAVGALHEGATDDLSEYESVLRSELGRSYFVGRLLTRALARPWFMRGFTTATGHGAPTRVLEDVFSDLNRADPVLDEMPLVDTAELA